MEGEFEHSIFILFGILTGEMQAHTNTLYIIANRTNCKPSVYKTLVGLLIKSFHLLGVARSMDGESLAPKVVKLFHENLMKAEEAYIDQCGCAEGTIKHTTGMISELLTNLPQSSDNHNDTYGKIDVLSGKKVDVLKKKLHLLLSVKNFNPSASVIQAVNEFSVEDIEIVTNLEKTNTSSMAKSYDARNTCIDKATNDISTFYL